MKYVNFDMWRRHFAAVVRGDLETLKKLLADLTSEKVTTEILQKDESAASDEMEQPKLQTLLVASALCNYPIVFEFLFLQYTWGFEKVQDAVSAALLKESALDMVVRLGIVPSLSSVWQSFFRRPVHPTRFSEKVVAASSQASTSIAKLIDANLFTAQELLHAAVLGDNAPCAQLLLADYGASVTRKAFWIAGYNSVYLFQSPSFGQQLPAYEGYPKMQSMGALRCWPALENSLEVTTGEKLLPDWAEIAIQAGQDCKKQLIIELQHSSGFPGSSLRIARFEADVLLDPSSTDDDMSLLASMARVLEPWECVPADTLHPPE